MRSMRNLIGTLSFLIGLLPIEARVTESEEHYWDNYVARWHSSNPTKALPLGSDWNHAEDFLAVLTRHASRSMEALEVGCGGGRITSVALGLVKHVHAADLSSEMLRCCRGRFDQRHDVSFHKLDGFTLGQFQNESMDLVFSHDVFVQLSSIQVYPYLAEIRRVLRNGGTGVISAYDFKDSFEMFKQTSLQFWNARKVARRRLHFMSEEMIRRMLQDLELEVVELHRGRFLTIVFRKSGSS